MAITDDDLDACFSTADFGVVATFDFGDVNGHFTEGSDAVQQYGVDIEAVEPSFTCRTDEVEDVAIKDTVEIEDATYTIMRKQKIGTGVSVLYLKT